MNSLTERILFERTLSASGASFVRMVADDRPVGFAGYQIKREVFQIIVLDVDKCSQRRGYGTSLVGFLEGVARDAGCLEIRICVLNGGSFEFWSKMGFSPVGDTVYMNKRLS